MRSIKKFSHPDSIAVIGASDREGSLDRQVITNLLYGYGGTICPVNANYEQIESLRCLPSMEEIPGNVALVIIIVPAPAVPQSHPYRFLLCFHERAVENIGKPFVCQQSVT